MSEPVEGTLTAGEVTTIEIEGRVPGVVVTATGADIWVSRDGDTPFVGNPNTAERVPAGATRTVDLVGPTDPTIVKLVSDGTASYTVVGVGSAALPTIGAGDAGKLIAVTAAEDGFELAEPAPSGASVRLNSWMSAFIAAAGAPAGAVVWGADGAESKIVGDDISFASTTEVAFDTPGLYDAVLDVQYTQTADADGLLEFTWAVDGDDEDPSLPSWSNQQYKIPIRPTAGALTLDVALPIPLIASSAGVTLTISAAATLAAGTVTLASGFSLNIARIA